MKTLVGAAEPEDRPPFGPQVTLSTSTTNTSEFIWRQTVSFVCDKCKAGEHDECPGNTRCDCQHKGQK